ncbi:hypothetical protein DY000_02053982 [Brassica cretica]|uniref:DUF223 domain-containing protein n=1 Tax=Brassica cretica TaxID=69181 RepID=A0ABQ7ALI3_BRACR|nr:hypothetical protein DY000_02053982 [Brassica cretica]
MSLSASPVPQTGVPGVRHLTFESLRLRRTGSIVKVDSFEVARCSSMYKITDHPFLIRFISPTIIDEVITGAPEINLQS